MDDRRSYRAGEQIEDYCRACKIDRMHTVRAADHYGVPIRVVCSYCRSEHNFRGGPRMREGGPPSSVPRKDNLVSGGDGPRRSPVASPSVPDATASAARAPSSASRAPFDIVSDRERSAPPVPVPDATTDLELLLRRVIREEAGVSPATPAEKWRGGSLVLRPGTPGVQEKAWPIETFFHKVVMLRNRLRTLEQHLNASDLPDDVKVKLQSYITGCYGSLTSFNVLFADEADEFKGAGSD
jgi:hypothetical protein